MGGKQEEWKTQEKNFSPEPTNFFLPNREEKQGEKTASVQFYRNAFPPPLHSRPSPTPPKTFAPNPYHFFSSSHLYLLHTVHYSRFSPLFFFFSNVITARTPSILEIVESAIIPHNDLSANYLWYKLFFFFWENIWYKLNCYVVVHTYTNILCYSNRCLQNPLPN